MDEQPMISFRVDDQVTLRGFKSDDAEAVFEAVSENFEHLNPFMVWIRPDYSPAMAKEFIDRSILEAGEKKSLGFGIFRVEKFIGSIGFSTFDWEARTTEIGYWIDKHEQGKGIISAACRLLINYAFDELGLNRIQIRCAAENLASAAIPEKFGFLKEGVLRQSQFRNGNLHDFLVYGLLASEWRASDSRHQKL
jgi:ribosomal-protein-serine acetyltransferase